MTSYYQCVPKDVNDTIVKFCQPPLETHSYLSCYLERISVTRLYPHYKFCLDVWYNGDFITYKFQDHIYGVDLILPEPKNASHNEFDIEEIKNALAERRGSLIIMTHEGENEYILDFDNKTLEIDHREYQRTIKDRLYDAVIDWFVWIIGYLANQKSN